jgi:hypothetical protein
MSGASLIIKTEEANFSTHLQDDVPVTSQPGARAPMPMPMPAADSAAGEAAGSSGERSPLKPAEAPPSYDSLYRKDEKE